MCGDDVVYLSIRELGFFVSMFSLSYTEQQNREIELKTKCKKENH